MTNFSNVIDAITWLQSQVKFSEKKDLKRLEFAYNRLKLNFSNTKKIQIGGTNGKGSTAAFINQSLIDNNLKVGLFTSPYLVEFNERIRVNNINISDNDLLNLINYFYSFNEQLFRDFEYKLSFFEILTLMALKHFSDNKCDVIIMEIGIGGRLDATSIINYDVLVITNIGFDHMKILGNTLEEIALEKVSALKQKTHLITTVDYKLNNVFINYANSLPASVNFINKDLIKPINNNQFYYKDLLFEISLLGDYQRENAVLAYEVIKYLFNFNDENIINSFKITKWAGRLEEIIPNIFIDGAHNKPAIEALFSSISNIFNDKRITIVFSALKDKDINEMLNIIKKYNYKVFLTSFPDFRFESLKSFENNDIKYIEDSISLINDLKDKLSKDEVIIITGSLHFIGYIKEKFMVKG